MDESSVKLRLVRGLADAEGTERRRPWQPPPLQEDLWADVEELQHGYPGLGISGLDGLAALGEVGGEEGAPEVVPFRRVR